MRPSKFTPSLCAGEGVFLGACSFIITCFNATANAPFGSSFFVPATLLAITSAPHHGDLEICIKRCCGSPWSVVVLLVVGQELGLGTVRIWFALLARCVALFACLVCCFVLAFGCLCPCWVSLPCHNWLFGSCLCRPEATALPLGPGLLVGGLGLVLSIPKLCFKPFRNFSWLLATPMTFHGGWQRS